MKWEEFQPSFLSLAETFKAHGHSLHLVGGCVRDHLLEVEPKDYDMATSARPDQTKEILSSVGIHWFAIGEKFGTIAAKLSNGLQIEITTYRQDGSGRHPDVTFCKTLEDDLGRRDFTINSMSYNPDGSLTDPYGGQHDLKFGQIACTGDAFSRFSEDPLRMLRAMRFVSKLGFSLEKRTEKAITELGNSILSVSRERWLEEMDKLLIGKEAERAIDLLARTRLLWFLIPDLLVVWRSRVDIGDQKTKDIWQHTKFVVSKVSPKPDVRWAALLHDVAKPQTMGWKGGKIHFLGHDALGAEIANGVARRFKMPNNRRDAIRSLVFLHQRVSASVNQVNGKHEVNMSSLRRLARECEEKGCNLTDLIDLFGADCSSMRESKRNLVAEQKVALEEAIGKMREEDLRPKLPSGIGNAIMEKFGLKAGPEVGVLRQKLDEMLVAGDIKTDDSIETMMGKLGDK